MGINRLSNWVSVQPIIPQAMGAQTTESTKRGKRYSFRFIHAKTHGRRRTMTPQRIAVSPMPVRVGNTARLRLSGTGGP